LGCCILWIWLAITVVIDIFRSHDADGLGGKPAGSC
jgi:hypothetical protein